MKILIVSFFFPPHNCIGAVRVGKFAKYLQRQGHEVRVLTARDQPQPKTLKQEIDEKWVTRTGWFDMNGWVRKLGIASSSQSLGAHESQRKVPAWKKQAGMLRRWGENRYRDLVCVPDAQGGWILPALRVGHRLVREFRPDWIFASALPVTSLFVARGLSRRSGVPWVGEYRDLWTGNPYSEAQAWRASVDRRWERNLLGSASGLVTVSDSLAKSLGDVYSGPVMTLLSGFDSDEVLSDPPPAGGRRLEILYTGNLYRLRRDPTPLFKAIQRLGVTPDRIRVRFIGKNLDYARQLRDAMELQDFVTIEPPIGNIEVLDLQRRADVNLLLLWDDPQEIGTIPGKVFEYIAARRPILALGRSDNAACRLLETRGLGKASLDPETIADWLRGLMAQKTHGPIASFDPHHLEGLDKDSLVRSFTGFLEGIA